MSELKQINALKTDYTVRVRSLSLLPANIQDCLLLCHLDKSLVSLANIVNMILLFFIIRRQPGISWLDTRHGLLEVTCDRTDQQSPPSQT